ncbi:signal peptidase complex catalytic subunit SEC11A-like isoform X2 [Branchiostoma floridae x Branchiostoma belcheri]
MANPTHRGPNARQRLQTLSEMLWDVIRFPVYIWLAFGLLKLLTCCEQPLTILSNRHGSMAPTLSSGDMLLLTNYPNDPINVGDIVCVDLSEDIEGQSSIHARRVAKVEEDGDGNLRFLVKGDNSDNIVAESDANIAEPLAPQWVARNDIIGKMIVNIPLIGIPNLLLNKNTPHTAPLWYLMQAYLYYMYFLVAAVGLSKLLQHL